MRTHFGTFTLVLVNCNALHISLCILSRAMAKKSIKLHRYFIQRPFCLAGGRVIGIIMPINVVAALKNATYILHPYKLDMIMSSFYRTQCATANVSQSKFPRCSITTSAEQLRN